MRNPLLLKRATLALTLSVLGLLTFACSVLAVPASSAAKGWLQLSDERTFTRWAHPVDTALIRSAPIPTAAPVGRLHLSTEEGEPEVYLLLSEVIGTDGIAWVRLRVVGRPNGRIGWVRRRDLGEFHLTHWALWIDLARQRATLFFDGRTTWSAPIGVGKPSTPTPSGHFWIRELLDVPGHTLYGPFAFGTSDYSVLTEWPHGGVVGIHGTNEPQLIPGRPSHGCIRMRNADIVYLAHHLPVGAPVEIVA